MLVVALIIQMMLLKKGIIKLDFEIVNHGRLVMKYRKFIRIVSAGIIFLLLSGCQQGNSRNDNQDSSQQEIGMKQKEISKGVLESFDSVLKYYPTPKIEDVLDENMGAQAILQTSINKCENKSDKAPLVSNGMVLYINPKDKKDIVFIFKELIIMIQIKKKKKNIQLFMIREFI